MQLNNDCVFDGLDYLFFQILDHFYMIFNYLFYKNTQDTIRNATAIRSFYLKAIIMPVIRGFKSGHFTGSVALSITFPVLERIDLNNLDLQNFFTTQ